MAKGQRPKAKSFMKVFLFCSALFLSLYAIAQPPVVSTTQLVLLNRERILARYKPGMVITYKLKHYPEFVTSLIIEIRDFSIVTSFDTIPFEKISRISLKGQPHKGITSLFGSLFFAAGIAYFAVDQINSVIVHGAGYDNDPSVWQPALIMVGTGLILKQIYKRSQRIRYPAKLLAVKPGSHFYFQQ
jgi:hypothetical protein